MDINWPEVFAGVVLGAVPSFLFGRRQGEQSAAGTRRFEASEAIHAVAGKFSEQLAKDHEVASHPPTPDLGYVTPATYGNRSSQKSLAAAVYFEARYLSRIKRYWISRRLETLVGPATMDKTRSTVHTADRTPPDGNALMNAALRDMLTRSKEGTAWKVGDGILTQVGQFGENWERDYATAQRLLNRIIKATKP